jgi:hypothetical protein
VTFILACVESFQNAYVRTGMNLMQSIVVTVIEAAREGWKVISHQSSVISHRSGKTDD